MTKRYTYIEEENLTSDRVIALRKAGWQLDYIQSHSKLKTYTYAFSKVVPQTLLATTEGEILVTSDDAAILIT